MGQPWFRFAREFRTRDVLNGRFNSIYCSTRLKFPLLILNAIPISVNA